MSMRKRITCYESSVVARASCLPIKPKELTLQTSNEQMNKDIEKQQSQTRPELVQATLDQNDITEHVLTLYGDDREWNHRTIYYKDFLTEDDIGKDLCLKWRRKNGRIDCVITRIRDLNAMFQGDLFHVTSSPAKKLKVDTAEMEGTSSSNILLPCASSVSM